MCGSLLQLGIKGSVNLSRPSITIHQTGTSAYYKFEIVHDRKEEKNFAAS
jgi:hypothetical protein